jgi:hypothetical protein
MGLVAALAVSLAPGAGHAAVPREYVVVASPSVPIDDVSVKMLRRLFALERQFWKPGMPAIPLLPPSGAASRTFLLGHVLETDEPGLKRMILEKLYRAEIDLAPKVTATDEETVSFVASGRGLFALVPTRVAKGREVKVLRVEGKLPGAIDYPLRD